MSYGAHAYASVTYGSDDAAPWRAEGWQTTQFGTPLTVNDRTQEASGWLVPVFGLARLDPSHVPSLLPVVFGTPAATQYWRAASLGPVTHISSAYTAFAQTVEVSGELLPAFGLPLATRDTAPSYARTVGASSFLATTFGLPLADPHRTGAASGLASTQFGAPTTLRGGQVTGFYVGAIGEPTLRTGHRATAMKDTVFGEASARIALGATGLLNDAQFGLPASFRSATYLAYGIDISGRFGQPTATRRFNYPATGFTGTHLGSPAAIEGYRAFHIPPVAVFGTPLLQRATQC